MAGGLSAPSPSRAWMGSADEEAQTLVRQGTSNFRQYDLQAALDKYNKAGEISPDIRPYLWQRGLTLYYLDRFQEAAQQFRLDAQVSRSDTEEAIWAYLSEASLSGAEQARKNMIQVGKDPRPILRAAYGCYIGNRDPKILLDLIRGGQAEEQDTFYANFYAGLWHEARGNRVAMKEYMVRAIQSGYCARIVHNARAQDLMPHCAVLHAISREFFSEAVPNLGGEYSA